MNYKIIYDNLINKAIIENNTIKVYEKHHIIPTALGGSNDESNLVKLTLRQHFIAHRLLPKFLSGRDKYKMICAVKRMSESKKLGYKISSRTYEFVKTEHKDAVSKLLTGRLLSDTVRFNMSLAQRKYFKTNKGHWLGKKHTPTTISLMRENNLGALNPQKNKPRTIEERNKISKTMSGVPKSTETIEKFKQRVNSEENKKKISESLRKYHAERNAGTWSGKSRKRKTLV